MKCKVKPIPSRLRLESLETRDLMATLYVAAGPGNDAAAGTQAAPFKSVQRAVNIAASGDTILVAGGMYNYVPAQDITFQFLGTNGVVTIVNKSLTIQGGYAAGNWAAGSNPAANPTILDAQGLTRGVLLTSTVGNGGAALNLSNVTVRNGFATGNAIAQGDDQISGFGGGLFATNSFLSVSNALFENNTAAGKVGPTYGGAAAGGGVSVRSMAGTVNLSNITFSGNQALGATGPVRGGYGQGGGLFAFSSIVNGSDLVFSHNYAAGGSSTGPGILNGETADGLGGGLELGFGQTGTLTRVVATGNVAAGGSAPNGRAGGGFGGGIYTEENALVLTDSLVQGNTVTGGTGGAVQGNLGAGVVYGGGIHAFNGNLTLDRVRVLSNAALGGPGSQNVPNGAPQGGGVAMSAFQNGKVGTITNSVIAGNLAGQQGTGSNSLGGGGGGVSVQGPNLTVTHSTIADNKLNQPSMFGVGVVVVPLEGGPANPTVTLNYSAITGNVSPGGGFEPAAAVHALAGTSAVMKRNLYFGNSDNDNSDGTPFNLGSFTFQNPASLVADPKFVSPGPTNFNYTPGSGSALVNAATGSTATVDLNGNPRNGTPDIGAVEKVPVQFGFASANFSANEQSGTATVTLTRGGDTSGTFTVKLTTFNGSGVAGTDYEAVDTAVEFAAGQTTATAQVPLISTAARKGALTVGLQLSDPSDPSAVLSTANPVTLWIRDAFTHGPGVFDPATGTWYLRNEASPGPAASFQFGAPGWKSVVGDWNGDGTATIGVVDPNGTWYIRNSNSAGPPAAQFQYGAPGWLPVTGDWDGDGRTDVGAIDPATMTWYLTGIAPFQYGAPGWKPVTGDWNGDGRTDVGAVNPAAGTWFLPGIAPFQYGAPGWKPIAGDWNGEGRDLPGVVDPNGVWYLSAAGAAPFAYGLGNWTPHGGDWNGPGGAPQRVAAGAPPAAAVPLTQAQLDAAVAAAIDRLQAVGLADSALDRLRSASYTVTNLPGLYLGLTAGNTVGIDATAAGRGWFADATPADDEEFVALHGADLNAIAGGEADGKVDLLTVVLHEMGRLLGADSDGDLMAVNLAPGTRRTGNLGTFAANIGV